MIRLKGTVLFIPLTILLVIFLCFFLQPLAAEAGQVPVMRVALNRGVAIATFNVAQGSFTLVDLSTGLPLGVPTSGDSWTVTPSGTGLLVSGTGSTAPKVCHGPLLLQPVGDQLNLFSYQGVKYRGSLSLQNLNGSLLVVNLIDIEYYLYGVVGREMGGDAALEALCAQVVASRSYALACKGSSTWYDVVSDTGNQVYNGYSGEVSSNLAGGNPVVEAVDRTRGQVLRYDGTLVEAVFSSNAGGCTEDSENVWLQSVPYLRGVASPADASAATSSWGASCYTWTKKITLSDLEVKLGIGEIRDIQLYRNRTQVKRDPSTGKWVQELIPGTRTVSGRVTVVTITGSQQAKSYYRDDIRALFGISSTLFDLDFGGGFNVVNAAGDTETISDGSATVIGSGGQQNQITLGQGAYIIGSGQQLVNRIAHGDQLVITGKGSGHGLGLSQWGARGMAIQGYKYRDILELYYNQGKNDGKLQIVDDSGL